MGNAFSEALRPLKAKMMAEEAKKPKPFKHHPKNHSLYAYNNNEQPNLGQLLDQCPPDGGMEAYLKDMDAS